MKIDTIDRFLKKIAIIAIIFISATILPAQRRTAKSLDHELAIAPLSASSPAGDDIKMPARVRVELQKGINSARQAMRKKKCAALFGDLSNAGFRTVFDLLNTYADNNLIRAGKLDANGSRFRNEDVGATTVAGMGSFTNAKGVLQSASVITINQKGFYFTSRMSDSNDVTSVKGHGFEGLDMSGIRGAVIIHELLHAMGRIPNDSVELLNDRGKQSIANSELVRRTCFR